jgi:phage terminase large subunit GpA-like protein
MLSAESSAEPGRWNTDRAPYQRGIMDALTDPTIREVWVMKSAQVGWTEILNNLVGYHVHQDPSPILLVQPTLEMAEAYSKDRLAPMVRDTPALRERISDARTRDSGNTLLHKVFPGGHVTLAGANSPSGLASRPIRVALFDEIDRYPITAGTEGSPINLARKRTTTFWNRRIAGGSTPTVKGASQIEARFEASDQRYLMVPCPHCDEEQRLVWAQVQWTERDPATAKYCCQHCGALWSDGERMQAVHRAGTENRWKAVKPFNGIAGFHINEIYSPFVRLSEMVQNFLEAKKLPETLQTFVNTSLAETWEETGSTVEPGSLLERRESYGPEQIPAGVALLTAGVDVQNDRVEIQLNGWGAEEENWIIEQHVIRGDPDGAALWQEVDEYLLRQFTTEDGRRLLIDAACIDSGGLSTQTVYNFVVSRKRRRVWAIKGMAGTGKLAWPKKASKTPKSRAMVFILGVDTIKSTLYGRLAKIADPGSGYIHLPQSADEDFCKQLTSEKAVTKHVRGRASIVWLPRASGIAQEAQDCWVYAYAAMLGRGGPKVLGSLLRRRERTEVRAVAQEQQEIPEPAPVKPPPVRKPFVNARRSGWVRRW